MLLNYSLSQLRLPKDKKDALKALIILNVGLYGYLLLFTIVQLRIISQPLIVNFLIAINSKFSINYFKIGFVILTILVSLLNPTINFTTKQKQYLNEYKGVILVLLFGGLILLSIPANNYLAYWIVLLPTILFFPLIVVATIYSSEEYTLSEDNRLSKTSKLVKEEQYTFRFGVKIKTDKKDKHGNYIYKDDELIINNPFQGILVEGGAGAGKSASVIEPIIDQAIMKGFSGVIYDFKGAPPTLGKTAINAANYYKSLGYKVSNIAIFNATYPGNSVRINPVAPDILYNRLFSDSLAEILMLSLNKEWIKKKDFWADNSILVVKAALWWLKKHYPQYCTLPHLIEFLLSNYELVLGLLLEDEEIEKLIQPVAVPFKTGASNQLAGVVSSYQITLSKLYNAELFYLLNPEPKLAFDLDVSNKANPQMLILCNDPKLTEAISPVLTVILSVIKSKINVQDKNPSLYQLDELPTIYVNDLSTLPATGRSNLVVTCLGLQDRSQLTKSYGKDDSDTVLSNMGNIFIGMTNNPNTASLISKMIGQEHKLDLSYSHSHDGTTSTSERLQLKTLLQDWEIMGQSIGKFTGKIAGGDPPFFHAQFKEWVPNYDNKRIEMTETTDELREIINTNALKIRKEIEDILNEYEERILAEQEMLTKNKPKD